MFHGIIVTIFRLCELLTLIPTLGMLSWFVHVFTKQNQLTPTSILVLFIVVVLASVWAFATLVAYHNARRNAAFVSAVDLLIFGGLIAGVYYLRDVTAWDCLEWSRGDTHSGGADIGWFTAGGTYANPFTVNLGKTCSMLKASFAFGIINIILFFVTFVSSFQLSLRRVFLRARVPLVKIFC
jgi:hypothetical protein